MASDLKGGCGRTMAEVCFVSRLSSFEEFTGFLGHNSRMDRERRQHEMQTSGGSGQATSAEFDGHIASTAALHPYPLHADNLPVFDAPGSCWCDGLSTSGQFVVLPEVIGGASRARTDDLIVANDALSQLSYSPIRREFTFLILTAVARFRLYTRESALPTARVEPRQSIKARNSNVC
jgi:hypothetical protein